MVIFFQRSQADKKNKALQKDFDLNLSTSVLVPHLLNRIKELELKLLNYDLYSYWNNYINFS